MRVAAVEDGVEHHGQRCGDGHGAELLAALSAPLVVRRPDPWIGHHDPIVGEALRRIHDEPEQNWTIVALARAIGISWAGLVRRFTAVVGEPVMTYLTRWRMTPVADLLANTETTVTTVAAQVGCASPFGFSTAFKRRYGSSPTAHRRAGHPEFVPDRE